jgi:peroxiredoxin Q/BCP
LQAVILGVSLDDAESHKKFAANHELPFSLLVDTEGSLAASYGVDTSQGYTPRVTFVIGPDGIVRHVFPKAKVNGHSAEVLDVLRSL